jgi:translation initiation factor 3 subunit A
MENINTDTLMRMHVEQLEKEKRELAQRMQLIGKRLDHVERAYRKEERPLLAKDYEEQQQSDRATFEAVQKSRIENSKLTHKADLETKQRLSRMMEDYNARKEVILARRGDEHAKKREKAQKKIDEEKAKRRQTELKAREDERRRREEEERIIRERNAEEARLEAGQFFCLPFRRP